MSAILSFLGGSAFRAIWGEVSNFFTKKQDHKYEIEKITLQGQLDAATHLRQMEQLRTQSELGIKEIRIKDEGELNKLETEAWMESIRNTSKPIGIPWVDAWNGSIRPAAGSVALLLWLLSLGARGFKPSAFDLELMCMIFGYFFADRSLKHRGK